MLADEHGAYVGPMRVWMKREPVPGLAMSRALGDRLGSRCGVSAEPEIIEKSLSAEDKFVIFASDGLWEVLSNSQVVELIVPYWAHKDVEGACDRLVAEALKLWETHNSAIDDITCLVVFINTQLDATTLV